MPFISPSLFSLSPPLPLSLFISLSLACSFYFIIIISINQVYGVFSPVGSYGSVRLAYQQDWVHQDFAVSVWLRPDTDCDGYILSKGSADGATLFYALKISADANGIPVSVTMALNDNNQVGLTPHTNLTRIAGTESKAVLLMSHCFLMMQLCLHSIPAEALIIRSITHHRCYEMWQCSGEQETISKSMYLSR